jgi:hypothetical protein
MLLNFILSVSAALRVFVRSRSDTALAILALRQQIAVLKRKRPRPLLNTLDRLFWTTLLRFWPRWIGVLAIVKSKTVVGWHRAGFRIYWRWHSRPRGGRPKITKEIRELIRQMAEENAGWGAPKIHGELLKLGFVACERTVARYLRRIRRRGDSGKNWLAFLENHREVIAAFNFFTLPTVTLKLLYCFFVIEHGISERGVGSCRREILDHVIRLNEEHLQRLVRDNVNYYHQDRVHDSLEKDTPNRRAVERKPSPQARTISIPRLGGLHHHYEWRQAA